MALTNAEKQARWRERNVVVLSTPAQDIVSKRNATPAAASAEPRKSRPQSASRFRAPHAARQSTSSLPAASYAQGRYVEAMQAALEVWDWGAIGDTMLAWGVSPKEAQAAGVHISQRDLADFRDAARDTPPHERTLSWRY